MQNNLKGGEKMKKIILLLVVVLVFFSRNVLAVCVTGDLGAPTRITDLYAETKSDNQLRLTWTVPSDQSSLVAYEVRYREGVAITTLNWSSSVLVTSPPTPLTPGTQQSMLVTVPKAGTKYYFGIKTKDGCNKWSLVSNSPYAITLAAGLTKVNLAWDPVTTHTDGTSEDKIIGYELFYGFESGVYEPDPIQNVGATTKATVIASKYLEYFFAVKAYEYTDTGDIGDTSAYSNEVPFPP